MSPPSVVQRVNAPSGRIPRMRRTRPAWGSDTSGRDGVGGHGRFSIDQFVSGNEDGAFYQGRPQGVRVCND